MAAALAGKIAGKSRENRRKKAEFGLTGHPNRGTLVRGGVVDPAES